MKEEQKQWFIAGTALVSLGIILGFLLALLLAGQIFNPHRYEIVLENETFKATGLNGGTGHDFIFIATEHRSLEEISLTAIHEVCHELVFEEKEHFCEGGD